MTFCTKKKVNVLFIIIVYILHVTKLSRICLKIRPNIIHLMIKFASLI